MHREILLLLKMSRDLQMLFTAITHLADIIIIIIIIKPKNHW
jgi:hypothetical protein